MDFSGRERDRFFLARAGAGESGFLDASYLSGADGLEDARAFARVDLDRDGFEDLVVVNRNAPLLRIYRNEAGPASRRAFLGLSLQGEPSLPDASGGPRKWKTSRDAAGARAIARCGPLSVRRDVELSAGFATTNSRILTFGLDRCEKLERLEVTFPGGERRSFEGLAPNRLYEVVEGKGLRELPASPTAAPTQGAPSPVAQGLAAGAEPSFQALLKGGESRGHPVALVSLFASWCEACKRALPRLEGLAQRSAHRPEVVLVSVEEKDDARAVAPLKAQVGGWARVVPFEPALYQAVLRQFDGHPPLPSALLLDTRTGQVLSKTVGVPTASQVEQLLWSKAGP